MPIPPYEGTGLLPPYISDPTHAQNHSPYRCSVLDIAQQLCASDPRQHLFQGFLSYRKMLRGLGIVNGFQWVDGSFTEQIEAIEGRDPNDIDIVTFFHRPALVADDAAWQGFVRANAAVFDVSAMKVQYHCHVHYLDLQQPASWAVEVTRFFNALFSHRRVTRAWKGMLRVELDSTFDVDAELHLSSLSAPQASPNDDVVAGVEAAT